MKWYIFLIFQQTTINNTVSKNILIAMVSIEAYYSWLNNRIFLAARIL